ncbi:MAG: hypothetical protein IJI49_04680 [Bacilli bacterium]|nr:hypothetical protein [Bacilli bacterium]
MENKNNNNGVIIGLLIGIIVMLLVFIALFETKTISFNKKEKEVEGKTKEIIEKTEDIINKTEEKIEEQTKIYTDQELLNMVTGIWYHTNNNSKYMSSIGNKGFSYGRYQTDGGIYGEINNIKYNSNNIYELTVFSKGCHESNGDVCMEEKDDATYIIKLDISEIDSKKIKLNIDGKEYYTLEYIGKTWEEVENKLND